MKSSRNQANAPAARLPAVDPWQWIGLIVLAVGSVCYGLAFIWQGPRARILAQLLRPEDILADWVAWSSANLGFLDRLPLMVVASTIWFAALGIGALCLRRLIGSSDLNIGERLVFSLGIGISLLSLATFLLGVAGGLHWVWLVRIVVAAAAAAGVVEAVRFARESWPLVKEQLSAEHRFAQCLAAGTFLFAAFLLWGSMLPSLDFDVLEYHLQVPKEWFQAGRITFMPHNIYGNMPLADEMLSLLAMQMMPGSESWWYGGLAGKLVQAGFVPLTAIALAAAGNRYHSPLAGWGAAVIYVGIPWLSQTALQGLNEPAVACFGWLAFQAALLIVKNDRAAWLAGFFAGSAVACKYPAVVLIAAPITVLVFYMANRRFFCNGRRVLTITGLCLIFLAIPSVPWLLKNQIVSGNPVYPLLGRIFAGKTRTPEKDAQFRAAHAIPADKDGSKFGFGPATQAVKSILLTSPGQSPLWLPFLVAGCIAAGYHRRNEPRPHWLLPLRYAAFLAAWMFLAWWLFTHRLDRFWIPALPLLVFMAGLGIGEFRSPLGKAIAGAILVAGMTYQFAYLVSPLAGDMRWFTRLDRLRAGQALYDGDIARLRAHVRYLNERVATDEAILLVGDAAVFELRPHVFYNTCFDDCLLVNWMQDRTVAERREEFAARHVKWVVVNDDELDRYRSPGNYGYDPRYSNDLIEELVRTGLLEPVDWSREMGLSQPANVRILRVVDGR